MMILDRIIFPLPNPLPLAGEGASVGCARPNRLMMRGKTF
jgi:hypothetical protein